MKRLVLLAAATLILLELVLQVGAIGVWLTHRPAVASDGSAAARTFLCIGDSFTYGIGATTADGPYPAQLEAELSTRLGERVHVVNGGWPGRNSAEMLRRIDPLLEASRPEHVFVLLGCNDFWTRPDLVTSEAADPRSATPADAGTFRWRWRTARFAQWLWDRAGDGHTTATGALDPVEGATFDVAALTAETWCTAEGRVFGFHADGTARIGEAFARWRRDGPVLELRLGEQRLRFRPAFRNADRLDLEAEAGGAVVELVVAPPDLAAALDTQTPGPGFWLAQAQFEMSEGRPNAAEALVLKAENELGAEDRAVLSVRLRLATASGRTDAATSILERLRARLTDEPLTAELAAGWLDALSQLNRSAELNATAADYARRFRDSFSIGFMHARLLLECSSPAQACIEFARVLELAETDHERVMTHLTWASASRENRSEAIDHLVAAYRLGAERQATDWARLLRIRDDTASIDACLAKLEVPAGERDAIRQALSGTAASDAAAEPGAILAQHLARIIARCRSIGAEVTLVGYPSRMRNHVSVMESLVASAGVAFVPVWPTFEQAMRDGRPREELYAADNGHCSNEGYGIIASLVADSFTARLSSAPRSK